MKVVDTEGTEQKWEVEVVLWSFCVLTWPGYGAHTNLDITEKIFFRCD